MSRALLPRRRRVPARVLGRAAAGLFAMVLVAVPTAPALAGLAKQPLSDKSVTMSVLSVTPSTPAASDDLRTFSVSLRLVNTTDESLPSVTIDAVRSAPIGNQQALDDEIAHPSSPDPNLSTTIATKNGKPLTTELSARGAAVVTFTTTTGIPNDAGICICANAIYPLIFTAHTTDVSGTDVVVGTTQTFAPAFYRPDLVQPVQVSWLWPILDRPHRLVSDQVAGEPPVFLDDDLAREVSTGRLSRLVDVLSAVAGQVPITVVIDPELIDELAVMSAGDYRVTDGKKTTAGVGTAAAKQWLVQLQNALGEPGVEVSYTPFADPDIQSLVNAGLSWSQTLGAAAQQRVAEALGGPDNVGNVWWPVGETLDQNGLAAIVGHGATSVVLNDHVLPSAEQPPGNALATVQTSSGPISAVITSSSIQRYVGAALSTTGAGRAVLPELVSEVAIRSIETPDAGGYVVITPPRDVDPDPANATAAILGTAHEFWSKGLTVDSATLKISPSTRGPLTAPASTGALDGSVIDSARQLGNAVPALASMFSQTDADRLLGSLPAGVQRAESSAWRTDPAAGAAFAAKLSDQINALESGVHIESPPNGRYTLASSNSPLPLTVENSLDVNVTVRVEVQTKNGLPGFTAQPIERVLVPAHLQVHLKVPTHVDRTGRFVVTVTLYTPSDRAAIGEPVDISVRSTGLGLVGVIITVVAGAVLALALVIRVIRRWRGKRRPEPPADPAERVRPESVPV